MDDVRLDSLLDLFHGPGLILGLLWLGLIFLIEIGRASCRERV